MVGKTFGRLTILKKSNKRGKSRDVYWTCKCSCGTIKDVMGYSIRSGNTLSCGCLHKDKISKPHGVARKNRIFKYYVISAKDRKLDFKLSKNIFDNLISTNCKYCGQKPDISKEEYNGIDRVDSKLGYTEENCVPCCSICNKMKWDLSLDMFFSHIKKIIKYNE